jgi:hypothetical protein
MIYDKMYVAALLLLIIDGKIGQFPSSSNIAIPPIDISTTLFVT